MRWLARESITRALKTSSGVATHRATPYNRRRYSSPSHPTPTNAESVPEPKAAMAIAPS